jgi:Flp pilus assembly protein TadD
MSLVNDMLRDLDDRKRSPSGAKPSGATAKSRAKRTKGFFILVVCFVIAIVALSVLPDVWVAKITQRVAPKPAVNAEAGVPVAQAVAEDRALVEKQVTASEAPLVVNEGPMTIENPSTSLPAAVIEQINWQMIPQEGGSPVAELTFWLANSTAFVVYEKSAERIELGLQVSDRGELPALPDGLSDVIGKAASVADDQYFRFVIETREPVRFETALKTNPTRFMVTATPKAVTPVAPASRPAEQKPAAVIESTNKTSTKAAEPPASTESITPTQTRPSLQAGTWRKSIYSRTTDAGAVREAKRLMASQQTAQAITVLSEQVARAPKSVQSRYLLAQLLLATEQYPEAQQVFMGAPDNLSWGLLKARYYLQMGQAGAAVQTLSRYPQGQQRADYIQLLAAALQQQGKHKDAVEHYLTLLAMDPNQASAWNRMAVSLEHLGRRQKAIDAYQNALKVAAAPIAERQFAAAQIQGPIPLAQHGAQPPTPTRTQARYESAYV